MAVLALILIAVWLAVVIGLNAVMQYRRSGEVPTRVRSRPGTTPWWAGLLGTLGLLLVIAAPIAELVALQPIPALKHTPIRLTGLLLALAGTVLSCASQQAMGSSWRANVDPRAHTALVTTGPFRLVRNPVLTGILITVAGFTLMTPNTVALAAFAITLASLEIQVRLVEEPYLRKMHDRAYTDYTSHTGRFLPLLGRLR
ncbi:isoprenylcysteine carboxylmethyltransferase family protein [Nocardia sp. 2]|uniref:Isoprenylcysteine carboxylmethyltransferase family protein n=1 Tax=Nocardia acididurans TaxID=2802282 RepID=A0ABS1M197_9NOCA|nr:isoprenylcysteine carboxylmethyltransferase family protein [Nocardia acididurans]MBL1073984.1 isoprenylcysteine carboxylmethyltransferase family protein [Nocardia acididurans]